MPRDYADSLLITASTNDPADYLTLAAVGDDRRETQLDRRAVGALDELRAWLAGAVANHGPGHERLRLRLWGAGGRPLKSAVIRTGAPPAAETPATSPSVPQQATRGTQTGTGSRIGSQFRCARRARP